jgi:hypothetical protein
MVSRSIIQSATVTITETRQFAAIVELGSKEMKTKSPGSKVREHIEKL